MERRMMKSDLRIVAVILFSSFAVAPQSFALSNDGNQFSRMIQDHHVAPIDVMERRLESPEMCVDESVRYDEPFTDNRSIGIAGRPSEPILPNQMRAAFDNDDNGSACIDNDYVGTWLGPHRSANGTAPIFGVTPNELPNRAILSLLGIDETPVRRINEPAAEPAALKVFCLKPEHGAPCSNRCIKAGLGCAPLHTHPYKSDAGWGRLFACNNLPVGYMCSFQFTNGDACHIFFGTVFPSWCVYTGGG
jgi:hypothetical protein